MLSYYCVYHNNIMYVYRRLESQAIELAKTQEANTALQGQIADAEAKAQQLQVDRVKIVGELEALRAEYQATQSELNTSQSELTKLLSTLEGVAKECADHKRTIEQLSALPPAIPQMSPDQSHLIAELEQRLVEATDRLSSLTELNERLTLAAAHAESTSIASAAAARTLSAPGSPSRISRAPSVGADEANSNVLESLLTGGDFSPTVKALRPTEEEDRDVEYKDLLSKYEALEQSHTRLRHGIFVELSEKASLQVPETVDDATLLLFLPTLRYQPHNTPTPAIQAPQAPAADTLAQVRQLEQTVHAKMELVSKLETMLREERDRSSTLDKEKKLLEEKLITMTTAAASAYPQLSAREVARLTADELQQRLINNPLRGQNYDSPPPVKDLATEKLSQLLLDQVSQLQAGLQRSEADVKYWQDKALEKALPISYGTDNTLLSPTNSNSSSTTTCQLCEKLQIENKTLVEQLSATRAETINAKKDLYDNQNNMQVEFASLWMTVQELSRLNSEKDKNVLTLTTLRDRSIEEVEDLKQRLKEMTRGYNQLKEELLVRMTYIYVYPLTNTAYAVCIYTIAD